MLGLWSDPARLLVTRNGRPLHFGVAGEGFYFASLPQWLPRGVKAVADRTTRVMSFRDGALGTEGEAILLPAQL